MGYIIFMLVLNILMSSPGLGESSHSHDHEDPKKEHEEKDHKKTYQEKSESEVHKDHKEHAGHQDHTEDSHGDHGADEHEHGSHDEKLGEGKAIIEIKRDGDRFRLSTEAIALIGIQSETIEADATGIYRFDRSALVFYGNNVGLYTNQDDWFEIVELSDVSIKGQSVELGAKTKLNGKVVTKGVALLRVAHLEATGQGGQGHVH